MQKSDYNKALEYATLKHKGQYRIGGEEYITHPVAVSKYLSDRGYSEEYIIAALFHDLLEDTDATQEEILALSSPQVLEAVIVMTKTSNYNAEEYIQAIKSNKIAFTVKNADRLHNLKCAICTSEEFKRNYIAETVQHYMDFSEEICEEVKKLAKSLEKPMEEYPFLYR